MPSMSGRRRLRSASSSPAMASRTGASSGFADLGEPAVGELERRHRALEIAAST